MSHYLIYQPSEKFWQNISLYQELSRLVLDRELKKLVVIIFSVVQIHLVHFSVQVATWRWSGYSYGLIVTEGLCIGFSDIVALVGQ